MEDNNNQNGKIGNKKVGIFVVIILVFFIIVVLVLSRCSVQKKSEVQTQQSQVQSSQEVQTSQQSNQLPSTTATEATSSQQSSETGSTQSSQQIQQTQQNQSGFDAQLGDIKKTAVVVGNKNVSIDDSKVYVYCLGLFMMNDQGGYTTIKYYCPKKTYDAVNTGDSVTMEYQFDNEGNISISGLSKI